MHFNSVSLRLIHLESPVACLLLRQELKIQTLSALSVKSLFYSVVPSRYRSPLLHSLSLYSLTFSSLMFTLCPSLHSQLSFSSLSFLDIPV